MPRVITRYRTSAIARYHPRITARFSRFRPTNYFATRSLQRLVLLLAITLMQLRAITLALQLVSCAFVHHHKTIAAYRRYSARYSTRRAILLAFYRSLMHTAGNCSLSRAFRLDASPLVYTYA